MSKATAHDPADFLRNVHADHDRFERERDSVQQQYDTLWQQYLAIRKDRSALRLALEYLTLAMQAAGRPMGSHNHGYFKSAIEKAEVTLHEIPREPKT